MATGSFSPRASLNGPISDSTLLSITEVEHRIHQLLTENATLRSTLQQNNTYMRQLSVTLLEWQEEVVRVQTTYKQKFEKAKELVIKLKEENAELKRRLLCTPPAPLPNVDDETTAPTCVSSSGSLANHHVQEGSESLDGYIVVASGSLNNLSLGQNHDDNNPLPSYDSLFKQSCSDRETSDALVPLLQREADSLRAQLAAEMESNKNKQALLNQTQDQLDRLMIEFQEMSKKWGRESEVNLEGALCATDPGSMNESTKLEASQRSIDELEEKVVVITARLSEAEGKAIEKHFRNAELEQEIARMKKSLETMDILKAQLDLYQSDFQAEREARQNLAGEKEALAQEVRQLKRRLEETTTNSSASASMSSPQIEQEYSLVGNYECPKCSFKYHTMDLLNKHLDVCLTQHMFP